MVSTVGDDVRELCEHFEPLRARSDSEARTRLTLTGHVERSERARIRAESHSNLCEIRAIARSLAVCPARVTIDQINAWGHLGETHSLPPLPIRQILPD